MAINPLIAQGYQGGIANAFFEGQQQRETSDRRNQLVKQEADDRAALEKYAELEQLVSAPPEVKARYVASQAAQFPGFASSPLGQMPPEQAFEAMRRGLAARIGQKYDGSVYQQQQMSGLGDIPISRQKIDTAPLQRQENWAAERSQEQRNSDRSYRLQSAQEARLSRPQAQESDEFARYLAMSPEQRELYDRFKGRPAGGKQPDGFMSPEVIAARQQDNANVLASITDAENMTGFFTTGLVGSVMGDLPGSNAYDLRAAVDTVKANIGFDRLTRMREESKTGGALGQVTERELALLQSVIDSLDANQSENALRVALTRVRQQYERAMSLYDQMKAQQGTPTQGLPPVEERVRGYYGTGQ